MSMDPRRLPKPVRQGVEGWWYENGRGIDVYLTGKDGRVVRGLIFWSPLLRAAQRSSRREIVVKREG